MNNCAPELWEKQLPCPSAQQWKKLSFASVAHLFSLNVDSNRESWSSSHKNTSDSLVFWILGLSLGFVQIKDFFSSSLLRCFLGYDFRLYWIKADWCLWKNMELSPFLTQGSGFLPLPHIGFSMCAARRGADSTGWSQHITAPLFKLKGVMTCLLLSLQLAKCLYSWS